MLELGEARVTADWLFVFNIAATIVFAASGVVAALNSRIDLFGALVVAVVTAVGGGTIRDLCLGVPVFWLEDQSYLVAALGSGLLAFVARAHLHRRGRWILYLDAAGLALFACTALEKSLALGLPASIAISMGVVTGIGGGIIRDLLVGRETLITSRELYATPIIAGLSLQLGAQTALALQTGSAALVGGATIAVLRFAAIRYGWQIPARFVNLPR